MHMHLLQSSRAPFLNNILNYWVHSCCRHLWHLPVNVHQGCGQEILTISRLNPSIVNWNWNQNTSISVISLWRYMKKTANVRQIFSNSSENESKAVTLMQLWPSQIIGHWHLPYQSNYCLKARGETPIWNGRGCSSKNSNYTPKVDQCACGSSVNWPLKEISVWSVSGHFSVNFFLHSTKPYLNGQIQ